MSTDQISLVLAAWGATLSTILAGLAFWKFANDKPKLNVEAELIYISCSETDDTKGTKIQDHKGNWFEVCLKVNVSNSGSKPIQIIAIYIDQKDSSHQITPEKLHVVLDPGTQAEATIQKEWLDNSETKEFGILDALGKRHPISQSNLKELSEKSNSLPTNKKNYENKETGEIVQAFQVKDPASITSKIKG